MTTASRAAGRWLVVAGLRRWAEGSATDEAAVELLIGLGARFTPSGCPWVRLCRRPGWFWLDPDQLHHIRGRLSDRERRVLALVASLLSDSASTPSAVVPLGRVA